MGAYEQVRHDVTNVYADVLAKHLSNGAQEGVAGAGLVPSLSVSGSKPAWLGEQARKVMAGLAGLGALAGLALLALLADESSGAASTAGAFAIVSLLVAYLTVAGFGTVAFSIGNGDEGGDDQNQNDDEADDKEQDPSVGGPGGILTRG